MVALLLQRPAPFWSYLDCKVPWYEQLIAISFYKFSVVATAGAPTLPCHPVSFIAPPPPGVFSPHLCELDLTDRPVDRR